MKASKLQYFFAQWSPLQIHLVLGGFAGASFFGALCSPNLLLLGHADYLLCFVPALLLGFGVGFLMSSFAPTIFLFVLPLTYWREKVNGSPFHEGDIVIILSKRHRGRRGQVYAVWNERHQVRVAIGDKEKEEVKDVFSWTEVWKNH